MNIHDNTWIVLETLTEAKLQQMAADLAAIVYGGTTMTETLTETDREEAAHKCHDMLACHDLLVAERDRLCQQIEDMRAELCAAVAALEHIFNGLTFLGFPSDPQLAAMADEAAEVLATAKRCDCAQQNAELREALEAGAIKYYS